MDQKIHPFVFSLKQADESFLSF